LAKPTFPDSGIGEMPEFYFSKDLVLRFSKDKLSDFNYNSGFISLQMQIDFQVQQAMI